MFTIKIFDRNHNHRRGVSLFHIIQQGLMVVNLDLKQMPHNYQKPGEYTLEINALKKAAVCDDVETLVRLQLEILFPGSFDIGECEQLQTDDAKMSNFKLGQ